jgi:CAAX protease family protein
MERDTMRSISAISNVDTSSARSQPWLFFGVTFALTWAFWIPAAIWGRPEPGPGTLLLHYLGGAMPPLVAIAMTFLRHGPEYRRDYWRRVIDTRRISGSWYAVILLLVPALVGFAALLDVALGGAGAVLESRFAAQPLSILSFAVFTLLFGPLPEELAWRGYALDHLQKRCHALRSSVVLGIIWMSWHVPLFLIEGSYQHGLVGTPSFWYFWIGILAQTVLMVWIYNNTRRSTLSAILFHFVVNFIGELLGLTARTELFYLLLQVACAVAVVAVWGPKTMTLGDRVRGSRASM